MELLQLIGQRCLDAYIMKVPAQTWITPRKREEVAGPSFRGTGGNREPVGKGKNGDQRIQAAQEEGGSGRKRGEEQGNQESEQMEEGRGVREEDRESLAPSEVSLVDLERSPGPGSPQLERSQEEEKEEEGRQESSFLGRVKGLFSRSFS